MKLEETLPPAAVVVETILETLPAVEQVEMAEEAFSVVEEVEIAEEALPAEEEVAEDVTKNDEESSS